MKVTNQKHATIYTPYKWNNIIWTALRKRPYIVIPVTHEDVYDFKLLMKESKYNFKVYSNGNMIRWD